VLALLVAVLSVNLGERVGSGLRAILIVAVCANLIMPGKSTDPAAFVGRIVGEHLARTEKPGTLVALATAGSTPFFADKLRFIDTLGLVDRTIARRTDVPILTSFQKILPGHTKGDGAYVLSRKPDIWILGTAEGEEPTSEWLFLSDYEAVRRPEFLACYRRETAMMAYDGPPIRIRREVTPSPLQLVYFRRHCLD
jgi:hypothetical protein